MTENADKKFSKNPEVVDKAFRRRFTAEYKRRFAIEAEACTQPGEIGEPCFVAAITQATTKADSTAATKGAAAGCKPSPTILALSLGPSPPLRL